jgi:hypothetical protein
MRIVMVYGYGCGSARGSVRFCLHKFRVLTYFCCAGEYGMHNDEPMGKTHRKLFSEWYTSVSTPPSTPLNPRLSLPVLLRFITREEKQQVRFHR